MERDLKKFIIKGVKFLLFTLFFYLISLCLWGNFVPSFLHKNLNYRIGSSGFMHSRIKEVKQTEVVDILFLGSSHSYRGFDTRIYDKLGYKTFNLGSSMQTPLQTLVLLKRYLKELNPTMIIFEVYPGVFSSDGVESSLDIISNDKNDIESVKLALEHNHIKVYNTIIYALYRNTFNLDNDFIEPTLRNGSEYIKGGFVEKKSNTFSGKKVYNSQNWDFNQKQFEYFENILEIIHNEEIKVILVQAPFTKNLYNSYLNNSEFDERMNKYGEYYNFNDIISLSDSISFYDPDHLNNFGVSVFNKELINRIFE